MPAMHRVDDQHSVACHYAKESLEFNRKLQKQEALDEKTAEEEKENGSL